MNEKQADRVAWGILYFLLALAATLLLLGAYALADLVI